MEFNWTKIVEDLSVAFNMDEGRKIKLEKGKVAKFIAAIPFLANCDDPERIALTHVSTYLVALKTDAFKAKPEDDVSLIKRLEMGNYFLGGNQAIIDKAMKLLALLMISDHERDKEEDYKAGKYNPINAGKMDFVSVKDDLLDKLSQSVECPEMDEIISTEDALAWWWNI